MTPTILSVHSFRGGTGKTNTTANLATALAQRGNRVGIVDTDIQSPGIHAIFGLAHDVEYTLNDYLWGTCAVGEAASDVGAGLMDGNGKPMLARGSLYLVPSSMRATDITRILRDGYDAGRLSDGYTALVEDLALDYLLLDTHPGLNEETLLSLSVSDVVVLLMRPDKQDIQGTAVTVDVARKLGVPRVMLVINRVLPGMNSVALRQQMEAAFTVAVGGVLPNSDDMMRLASSGVFTQQFPDDPWSREINRIVDSLLAEQVAAQPA